MVVLGIDIGGTSIKCGLVNEAGVLKNAMSFPVDYKLSQEEQINALILNIKSTYASNDYSSIGIGIPGSIDSKAGIVQFSNNLKWNNLHIVEMFKKEFPSKKIAISNDANVAALGELKFGAGKNEKNIVLITLGTGIGSGIIIDGKIYDGEHGRGAEFGHSLLVMDGIKCSCGRKGCLEMYASASALIRQTKEAMKENPDSLIAIKLKDKEVTAKKVFDFAELGCPVSISVVNTYVKYLSEGLLNICNIFRPSSIILCGGVANQGDKLTKRVTKYLEDNQYGFSPKAPVNVKCSQLGYNLGVIGAASLIF